jgi:hypothetical protein
VNSLQFFSHNLPLAKNSQQCNNFPHAARMSGLIKTSILRRLLRSKQRVEMQQRIKTMTKNNKSHIVPPPPMNFR